MEILSSGWVAAVSEGFLTFVETAAQQDTGGSGEKPRWVDLASGVQSVVTAAAILLGGVWAAFRFQLFRETAPKMEFQLLDSNVVQAPDHLAVYVTAFVANRGRGLLRIERIDMKWSKIVAETEVPLDPEPGEPLRDEPMDMEPNQEFFGVIRVDVPNDTQGVAFQVTMHLRRVGLNRLASKALRWVLRQEYREPVATQWSAFVPTARAAPVTGRSTPAP